MEAHRILNLPNASAFLDDLAKESGLQAKLTSEAVVRELRYIGFSDISKLFDENDQLIPITELPQNVSRAIKYFKMEIRKSGRGDNKEVYRVVSVRLWDKLRGLQLLGKWLSMFRGKLQIETEEQIRKRIYEEIRADGKEAMSLLVANYRRLKKINANGGYDGDGLRINSDQPQIVEGKITDTQDISHMNNLI